MILDPSSLFWLKVTYISTWPPATSFLNFDSSSQFVISDTGARFLMKDLSVQLLILELRVRFLFYLKKRKREMSLIPDSHLIATVDYSGHG